MKRYFTDDTILQDAETMTFTWRRHEIALFCMAGLQQGVAFHTRAHWQAAMQTIRGEGDFANIVAELGSE